MNDLFLSYELSILIATTGFNETCFGLYSMNDESFGIKQSGFQNSDSELSIAAPSWDQAFKYLLELVNSNTDWQDDIELVIPVYRIVTTYFKDEFDRKEVASGKEDCIKWLCNFIKNGFKI